MDQNRNLQNISSEKIQEIFEQPLIELIFKAQTVHRLHFDPNQVQISTLHSIKTGACPEDCAYCPQSGHYSTGVEQEPLLDIDSIIEAAIDAKNQGATRFCMGAAWRSPPEKAMPALESIVKEIKALGLETCMTLGMLSEKQAIKLKSAGLDFYNHNLDTSPEYYKKIITTRTYADRLQTIGFVREAGIKVCCGGIIGMGETRTDRIELLRQLVSLPQPPESVTINHLIPIGGTPLENCPKLDSFEFIRMIATARILMPTSFVRLSAGRKSMSEETQFLCFLAGANSIHSGEKLLTTKNVNRDLDKNFFENVGLTALQD